MVRAIDLETGEEITHFYDILLEKLNEE